MRVKGDILCRLFCIDIKACAVDLAAVECVEKSVLVDVVAAGCVDEHNAVLHLCDCFGIDEGFAVDSGGMERDEIGNGEELIHFNVSHVFVLEPGNLIDIVCNDLHSERLSAETERLTDSAVADDTERFTRKLDALICFLFPLAFTHCVACYAYEAGDGEHVSERELRHRVGTGFRRVHNLYTFFFGINVVDIVDTYAAADDELQPACFSCCVDDRLSDFCCRTDDENVEVLYLFCKLFGLIKLLNYLVALSRERGGSILFNTV